MAQCACTALSSTSSCTTRFPYVLVPHEHSEKDLKCQPLKARSVAPLEGLVGRSMLEGSTTHDLTMIACGHDLSYVIHLVSQGDWRGFRGFVNAA